MYMNLSTFLGSQKFITELSLVLSSRSLLSCRPLSYENRTSSCVVNVYASFSFIADIIIVRVQSVQFSFIYCKIPLHTIS